MINEAVLRVERTIFDYRNVLFMVSVNKSIYHILYNSSSVVYKVVNSTKTEFMLLYLNYLCYFSSTITHKQNIRYYPEEIDINFLGRSYPHFARGMYPH